MELVISGDSASLQDSLLHTVSQHGQSDVEIIRGNRIAKLNNLAAEITDHGRSPILHRLIMTTTGDLPGNAGQIELSQLVAQRVAPDTNWVLQSHEWLDDNTPEWVIPYLERTYPYDRQRLLGQFAYDNEAYNLLNKLITTFAVMRLEQQELSTSLIDPDQLGDFNLRALATYTKDVLETPGVIALSIGKPAYNSRYIVLPHRTNPGIAANLNLDYVLRGADDNLDLLATIRHLAKSRAI